jgi:hypothetical protein
MCASETAPDSLLEETTKGLDIFLERAEPNPVTGIEIPIPPLRKTLRGEDSHVGRWQTEDTFKKGHLLVVDMVEKEVGQLIVIRLW